MTLGSWRPVLQGTVGETMRNRTPIVPLMGQEVALDGWFCSWHAPSLALPRTPPQLEDVLRQRETWNPRPAWNSWEATSGVGGEDTEAGLAMLTASAVPSADTRKDSHQNETGLFSLNCVY